MKKYLENIAQEVKELIKLCSVIADSQSVKAYLVGGFVRDLILGVGNLDLDMVVEGDGIKFGESLATGLQARLVRHRRFGTATVVLGHNSKIDIATAREEWYPLPASLPQVHPGTVKDDLKRRDFSINAMAISINKEDYASLIDFFGGLGDLRHKKIRILHDLSFIDDPTRILRAIRFEKRYDFKIEQRTLGLLKEAGRLKMLQKVQPQRLRDELILILKENHPVNQLKRIQKLVGFSFIHPRLNLAKNNLKLLESSQRGISWFKKTYPQCRHLDSWLIYLAALLQELKTKEIKTIFKAFVFRKGEEKRVLAFKSLTKNFILQLSKKYNLASRIYHLLDPLSYEAIILIRAKHKNRNLQKHIADFLSVYNSMRVNVTGDDLRELGISPGPGYQKIFRKVFDAKLDGKVHTKEEEVQLIKKIARI